MVPVLAATNDGIYRCGFLSIHILHNGIIGGGGGVPIASKRDSVLLKIEAHFVSRRERSTVTTLTELYRILSSSLIC